MKSQMNMKTMNKAKKAAPPPLVLSKVTKKARPEIVVVQSQVQIPLTLPRVEIPLVPHLDDEFDHDIVSISDPNPDNHVPYDVKG